ncbi:hypothetical protein CUU64_09525 [Bacillus sp. V5-8f]|nr:hypothetical protein CUU64_09525 [Bacillus sp. V5-8f]
MPLLCFYPLKAGKRIRLVVFQEAKNNWLDTSDLIILANIESWFLSYVRLNLPANLSDPRLII